MNEDTKIPVETESHIKTLFARLTEIILSVCVSREKVGNAIIIVGSWTSVMFASLILMLEENQAQSGIRTGQIVTALSRDIKNHMNRMREMKKGKEKSQIIT